MAAPDPPADATREHILRAATDLLARHGPGRTTVVDIARACGMSHANVYRFYAAKADLWAAVTDRWLRDTEAAADRLAAGPGSAADRLEACCLELLRRKRDRLRDQPFLYDTYLSVTRDRADVIARHKAALTATFARLLADGTARGEFRIRDGDAAFRLLHDATIRFHHPALVAEWLDRPQEAEADARVVCRAVAAAFAAGVV